jgi:hypothetical protein
MFLKQETTSATFKKVLILRLSFSDERRAWQLPVSPKSRRRLPSWQRLESSCHCQCHSRAAAAADNRVPCRACDIACCSSVGQTADETAAGMAVAAIDYPRAGATCDSDSPAITLPVSMQCCCEFRRPSQAGVAGEVSLGGGEQSAEEQRSDWNAHSDGVCERIDCGGDTCGGESSCRLVVRAAGGVCPVQEESSTRDSKVGNIYARVLLFIKYAFNANL